LVKLFFAKLESKEKVDENPFGPIIGEPETGFANFKFAPVV